MIRISLTQAERERLIRLRKGGISEHSEKILMVLLSDQGKSPVEISEQLQRNPHTVRDWLKRYQTNGIAGFQREYSPGRPDDARQSIISVIKEIIEDSPSEYGFISNSWTAQLLVDHLKALGIDSSIDTVKRALKDLGYTYKRPSKTVPKTAFSREEKRNHMLQLVSRIKAEIQQGDCEIFALDETCFSTDPYVNRGWIKRGEKKTSHPVSTRQTNPVWCLKSKNKAYVLFEESLREKSANTGNSQFLKQFLQQLEANNPSKKLLIILDNARFHISKYIKDYLRNHKNIVMFFLPTYSPEYNPIERFWLWLKQKVYGFKSFDYIEDILSTIRKTIWCYNENRMKSKINFKMSIYENIL